MNKEVFFILKSAIKSDIIIVTKKKKRLTKLLNNPKETSFEKVYVILNDFGYKLDKVRGSHFTFKGSKNNKIHIPVHKNKVKKHYIKKITKQLYEKNS